MEKQNTNLLRTSASNIKLIGDPHFGRVWHNGVPLNRRGDREAMQAEDFKKLLNEVSYDGIECKTVVIMGDLFDKFHVSNDVLFSVHRMLAEAAWDNSDVQYIVLQGNHDISRNINLKSSFDVLSYMLAQVENITFVKEPTWFATPDGNEKLLFLPYDAFTSASELVDREKFWKDKCAAVFGHWDIQSFGGNDHNLIPLKELGEITDLVVTGHIHTPEVFYTNKEGDKLIEEHLIESFDPITQVIVVGSMQPYSFAEDPDGELYKTITLEEYQDQIDKSVFKDKAIRILLKPGQEPPEAIDCLQFAYKFMNESGEDEELEAKMEIFSFKELFDECMDEHEVPKEVSKKYWDKYTELNTDAKNA